MRDALRGTHSGKQEDCQEYKVFLISSSSWVKYGILAAHGGIQISNKDIYICIGKRLHVCVCNLLMAARTCCSAMQLL